MGLLDDQLAIDAAAFTDTDGVGESVIYKPLNGAPKTIHAVVIRHQPGTAGESSRNFIPSLDVFFANDATNGVTSIDTGGDKINLKWRLDKTAADYGVFEIVDQDHGMWHVRLK